MCIFEGIIAITFSLSPLWLEMYKSVIFLAWLNLGKLWAFMKYKGSVPSIPSIPVALGVNTKKPHYAHHWNPPLQINIFCKGLLFFEFGVILFTFIGDEKGNNPMLLEYLWQNLECHHIRAPVITHLIIPVLSQYCSWYSSMNGFKVYIITLKVV